MELTKRLIKGLPLTAQEGDANWSAIEQALNDLLLAFSSSVDDVTLEISNGVIRIKASGVSEEQLASEAVTTAKIALLAITEALIADGAITGAKIGTGAVIEINLADGSVTRTKIADLAVGEGNIESNAVTSVKLSALAVTVPKVDYGSTNHSVAASMRTLDCTTGVVFVDNCQAGLHDVTISNIADGQSITVILKNTTGSPATPVTFTAPGFDFKWAEAFDTVATGSQTVLVFVRAGNFIFAGSKTGFPT